jgi:hypothetical protein
LSINRVLSIGVGALRRPKHGWWRRTFVRT